MPAYDSEQFAPPAPLARVLVRARNRSTSIAEASMLIDSGADVTLLPRTCADQLGLHVVPQEAVLLRGFDGTDTTASVVDAELLFLGRAFRGRFPIVDDQCGVLGRNVINHLSLVLDGPQLTWREGA